MNQLDVDWFGGALDVTVNPSYVIVFGGLVHRARAFSVDNQVERSHRLEQTPVCERYSVTFGYVGRGVRFVQHFQTAEGKKKKRK
jgi:hypothetical protein